MGGLISSMGALTSAVEPWQVELETATETLKRHFQVASLDGFGLQGRAEAIRAASAVLAYLREMQPGALTQLVRLNTYTVGEFMTLDESTRRNLELTSTIRSDDVKGSLLHVVDSTLTPMGGRLLRRWLNQPLLNVDAIDQRLDAVQFFYGNTTTRLEVRDNLRNFGDLERWTNRIAQGVAVPRDLVGIREVLRKVPEIEKLRNPEIALNESGAQSPNFSISSLFELPPCTAILDLLTRAIAEEPPASMAKPGVINDGFSAELDELVDKSRHAKDWIANLEKTERERLDIKSLKVGYNKVFGYYIEVTHVHTDKVPKEYIRKQTLTNAERYITPDLKEYESLVLNADERRLTIEAELFKDVCGQVANAMLELLTLASAVARIDLFSALAEVALNSRYVRPHSTKAPASKSAVGVTRWSNCRRWMTRLCPTIPTLRPTPAFTC